MGDKGYVDSNVQPHECSLWSPRCRVSKLEVTSYSLSTAQIHNDLLTIQIFLKKRLDRVLDGLHAKPVASVDQWASPLRFADKWSEEVRLVAVVQLYNAPF